MDRGVKVRPAEGRPAIVTGCAGVSCPVTLVAGVSDCGRPTGAPPPPVVRRYTALVH
jgi:hypothetical protein